MLALCYHARTMRRMRTLVRSAGIGSVLFFLLATPAFGQSPSPSVEAGFCAPWHRCAAIGILGVVGLATLFFLLGYAIQRRGFDKLEHRQGSPDGVPVGKT